MPKITEIFGKLCCGSESTHKQLLNEIYPKEKNGPMGKIGNFTQYAINNFDNLPKIGQDLQTRVETDVKQGNVNYAVIGCKIFESLVQSCHQEIISIRLNIEAVLKLFFASQVENNVELKIAACELLSKLVQTLDENSTSNLAEYVDTVIQLISYEHKEEAKQIRVQITALRTVSKVNQRLHLHSSMNKIIPGVLKALKDDSDTSYDFKGLSNDTRTLTDVTVELKVQDLRESAADCFLSLAKVTTSTHIRGFMKCIFSYLDDSKLWIPSTFSIGIMKILLSGVWSKHGYTIVNNFLVHLDKVEDIEIKISILKTITTVIEKQHASGTVGPTSIESLRGLIQYYIASCEVKDDKNAEYQSVLLEAVDYMAKRGEHSSQNIDLLETCLSSVLKDMDSKDWEPILKVMIVIASHPATIPSGKHFPDKFIKPLLDQCMKGKPNIRILSLSVLIQMMYSSVKIRGKDESGSSSNRVHATFSQKQREDVYYCLYETSSLEDNNKAIYSTILSFFVMLLTQFRNKDLEQSLPIMFGLQELRIAKATSNDIFVHTLIASYFQVLCSIYTNIPELKDEIERVVESRINEKSLSSDFPKVLQKIISVESDSGVILPDPKELEVLFVSENLISSVDSNFMFDQDRIIGILNKSESIKQHYPNNDIKELFSRKINERSNDLINEEKTEYQNKILFEDDATEKSFLTDDHKFKGEDFIPMKEDEVKTMDYSKLGEMSSSKRQNFNLQKKKLFLFLSDRKKDQIDEDEDVEDVMLSDDESNVNQKNIVSMNETLNSIEIPNSQLFGMLTYNL